VGCGGGNLTRQLAKKGAKVLSYDLSKEQISLAKKQEQKDELGIKYFVSEPEYIEKMLKKEFDKGFLVDKAVSTLVLHYAKDFPYLIQFFESTFNLLKDGGEFVGIISNPDYKKLNQLRYNRFFQKTKTGMKADFFDFSGKVSMTIQFSDFSRKDYENASKKAGFKSFKWVNMKIDKLGIKKMGSSYWNGFEEDCPYVGFIAKKD